MPPRRATRAIRCAIHRTEAPAHGGLVGVLDALAHLLRCRGPEHFVVALESALRLGVLGGRDRAELRARIEKRHHRTMVVHEWELVEAAILAKVERGLHLERRVVG